MNSKELNIKLAKIGKGSNDFDTNLLEQIINNFEEYSKKTIELAIKNLARKKDIKFLNLYLHILSDCNISSLRREALSGIGRISDSNILDTLIYFLKDKDPEIVLQSVRGLLKYKKNSLIKTKLLDLKHHPNEIIQSLISLEFETIEKKNKNEKPHTYVDEKLKNKVVNGDVLKILKNVPKESFHLTFTSPPYYNARDYSIYQSYKEYLFFLEKVFKKIYKCTKEGRFCIVNTSPVIIPRVGRKYSSKRYPIPFDLHSIMTKIGWEFVDDIVWIKPEASVKNRIGGFMQHNKPLGYKPNSRTEMIMVYRKESNKLLDWNIRQYSKEVVEDSKVKGDYETSNTWFIDPVFDKTHSAVFPIELCNRIIKYYSYKGDLVFDPFGGSGTFGLSAMKNKRNFFITEKNCEYFSRIEEKLGNSGVEYIIKN